MKKLTEEQYIVVSDLARLRVVESLLRWMVPLDENGIDEAELSQVRATIAKWRANLEKKVSDE